MSTNNTTTRSNTRTPGPLDDYFDTVYRNAVKQIKASLTIHLRAAVEDCPEGGDAVALCMAAHTLAMSEEIGAFLGVSKASGDRATLLGVMHDGLDRGRAHASRKLAESQNEQRMARMDLRRALDAMRGNKAH
jgi:hypothetical protein